MIALPVLLQPPVMEGGRLDTGEGNATLIPDIQPAVKRRFGQRLAGDQAIRRAHNLLPGVETILGP
ncbi:hypothetical protein IBA8401_38170 [Pseudomonas syringae]